jgi:hypothetical protein
MSVETARKVYLEEHDGDGEAPPGTKIGTLLTNPTGDGRALVNALADEYDVVVDQVMPNGQMNLAILEEASADAE